MFLIKKLLLKCKWKVLRYLVKNRKISFHKTLVRMHHIQQLERLEKYDKNKLVKFSYNKLKKCLLKNFQTNTFTTLSKPNENYY